MNIDPWYLTPLKYDEHYKNIYLKLKGDAMLISGWRDKWQLPIDFDPKTDSRSDNQPKVRSISKEVILTIFRCLHCPTAILLQRTYPQVILICVCYSATSQHHESFFYRIRRCRTDGGHRWQSMKGKISVSMPLNDLPSK